MLAAGHHRGRQVMGAGDDVGEDLRFGRVGDRWLQHTDDRRRARAEANRLSDHRRIAVQARRPETVRQHRHSRRVRPVVLLVQQPADHRMKAHDLEVRAADDAGADLPRLAEADHREADLREVADTRHRLQTAPKIEDLGDRERRVLVVAAGRALADVDQPAFVAIDQRTQQHAANDAENRRVGADSQRERQHHGSRQSLGTGQRTERELELVEKSHA